MPPNPYAMCTFTCAATAGLPSCETVSSSEQGPAPPSITGVICEVSADAELEFCFWPTAPGSAAARHVKPKMSKNAIAQDRNGFIRKPKLLKLQPLLLV